MAQENLINYINNICRKKEHSLKWEVVGNEIEDFKVVINFKRHKKLNQNQLFKLKKAMSLDSKNQPKPKMGDEFPKILQERLELLETRVKRNSLDSTNLSQEISQLTSKIIKGDNKSIKGSPKSRKKNPFRRLGKGEKLSGRKGKLKFSLSVENLTFQSDIERRKEFLSIEKPSWLYEEDELQESPKSPRKTWMGKPDRNSKLSRSSFTEEKEQRPKSPTKPKSFKEIRSNKKRNEVERINKNNYKGQMRGKPDRKLKTREKRSKSLTDSTKEVEQIEKKIIASEITPPQSPSLQLKEEKRENNSGKQGPDIITYDELEQQERDISRRTDITTSISKNIPTLAESVNDIKKEETEVTPTSASAIKTVTAGIEIDENGNELERPRTTNLKISKLKRQSRTLSREYSEDSNSSLTSDNANIPVMTHSDNETEKARKKRANSENRKLEKKSPNDQSQFSNEEEILPVSKMLGKTGWEYCSDCSFSGFCDYGRHKEEYLKILKADAKYNEFEYENCPCNVCTTGGAAHNGCVYREIVRLRNNYKLFDRRNLCICSVCVPFKYRTMCLRQELRILRQEGKDEYFRLTHDGDDGRKLHKAFDESDNDEGEPFKYSRRYNSTRMY